MNRAARALGVLAALLAARSSLAAVGPGERDFVDAFVKLPKEVTNIVSTVLPESSKVGSSYLSEAFDPNLVISEPSNVFVTFVHEGAGYLNSVGYFTFETDGGDPVVVDRQLVFPNASYADPGVGWGGGKLSPGDTVTLRDAAGKPRVFQPGERIGFFLVANGWSGGAVKGWDPGAPALPFETAAKNAEVGVMTTLDGLNPERSVGFAGVSRHVAMLQVAGIPAFEGGDDFLLIGFEDLRRDKGADDDFNDVVLLVRSNPVEAILTDTIVPRYDPLDEDPDGDGVKGLADYFPDDPERAFVVRTPPSGWSVVAFEDMYPSHGDADYNDAVVEMAFEEVLDAKGELKDVVGTFHLVARGASLDHRFGVALHGVPEGVQGSVAFERFGSKGDHTLSGGSGLDDRAFADLDGVPSLLLDDVFPSTAAALVADDGPFSNTTDPSNLSSPASARFALTFATAVPRAPLGLPPYDPFLAVVRGKELWDIHLPGFQGLPDRPASLPVEKGASAFLDADGYPFAVLVPKDWRYPLEKVRIDGPSGAYPDFATWRKTSGASAKGWYSTPAAAPEKRTIDPVAESLHARAWTLSAAAPL